MTQISSAEQDTLQRFIFENSPIRGELVHLDSSWQSVLSHHDYPAPVQKLLGEMMAASALLVSTLKFEGTLTIQFQGSGPISLMVMEASNERAIRGIAHWQGEIVDGSLKTLLGNGTLAITIDPAKQGERYQGIVEITGETLAESLEHYLTHSEQLDTHIWLAADDQQASGMMLQRMPGDMSDDSREDWDRATALAATIRTQELLELPVKELLHRLFHEEELRLFDAEPVCFRCSCSRERVGGMLKSLGIDQIHAIINDEGSIEVGCEFCNQKYSFDKVDAEELFAAEIKIQPPKQTQ